MAPIAIALLPPKIQESNFLLFVTQQSSVQCPAMYFVDPSSWQFWSNKYQQYVLFDPGNGIDDEYLHSFNWVIKFPPLVFKISFVGLELFVGSGEQDK